MSSAGVIQLSRPLGVSTSAVEEEHPAFLEYALYPHQLHMLIRCPIVTVLSFSL